MLKLKTFWNVMDCKNRRFGGFLDFYKIFRYFFFKLEPTFYNTVSCWATKGYTFQIKDGESLHRHIYCSEIKVSSVVRFILKVWNVIYWFRPFIVLTGNGVER